MEYITTVRLGESGHWKGSYYSFILHFQDQLCKLDDLQDSPAARFSPESHKVLLPNAVKPICELHAIQTTAEQLITSTGTKQPYKTYILLLTTATQRLDNITPSTCARRSANAHEFFPELQELMDEQLPGNGEIVDDEEYTINSPVDLILANAHARLPRQPTGFNPATRLSEEVFHALSSDGK